MAGKSMKVGGGGRFAALKGKLAGEKGVTDPGALAASIGRKKFGNEKMSEMAEKGKERAESKTSTASALKSAFGGKKA